MSNYLDRFVTAVVVLAAVAVAAAALHREFFPSAQLRRVTVADGRPPQYDKDWRQLLAHSILVGDSAAPVQIVEFSDLECPFCRRFHSTLEGIRQRFGSGVGLAFVHFPLPMHRFGEIAARAAECAEQQGRFAAFIDVTYRKQDSLGLKNWASYGQDAGVPDSARFRRCVESAAPVARIDSGLAVGKRIGVEGTPTVIVGGWRFFAPPSSEELARVVRALLTGEAPFPVTASRAN